MTKEEQKITLLIHRIKDNCYEVAENLLKEHDKQIRAEVIDKFTNVLKEKHFTLYNIQEKEDYEYPSYIELNDIYMHIDEVAEQLKESENKNEVN